MPNQEKYNARCTSRNGAKDRSTRDGNAEKCGIIGPARNCTNQNSYQTTSTINIQNSDSCVESNIFD